LLFHLCVLGIKDLDTSILFLVSSDYISVYLSAASIW
jgi:hypothetical protein